MEHNEFKFSQEKCGVTPEPSEEGNFRLTVAFERGSEVKHFTGKELEGLEQDLATTFEEEAIMPDQLKLAREHLDNIDYDSIGGVDIAS
ncbi:MAG: hypothetical protein ACRBCK_10675 [Alphaproteobacteria bacterium]